MDEGLTKMCLYKCGNTVLTSVKGTWFIWGHAQNIRGELEPARWHRSMSNVFDDMALDRTCLLEATLSLGQLVGPPP